MRFQPVVRWFAFRIPEEHLLQGQTSLVITAVPRANPGMPA